MTRTRERYPRVAELPFDTAYKLMATFHRMTDELRQRGHPLLRQGRARPAARARLVASGPRRCAVGGRRRRLQATLPGRERAARPQGLRVIATARRDFDAGDFDAGRRPADADGRADAARRWSASSTRRARRRRRRSRSRTPPGIQVRMITGDHAITAEAIARELGIQGRAISGAQFAELDDAQADAEIDEIGVIARVTPEQKVRLVDILKAKGHVVGDDGRRRQRRAGAQARRHRDRDGDHRHRGLQGGRGDDPHRRQLRDDREGRRARPRALRQPRQVHPLPDGRAGRDDRDLPRREHPQHRQRHPVPADADAVGELHHAGLPGGRARLRHGEPRG